MQINAPNNISLELGKPAIKPLDQKDIPLAEKKAELRKATKEFESFFLLNMLQAMRKTIPKSGLTEKGLGGDVYTQMFDEQLALKMAGTSKGSLAEMLYNSLVKNLEAEAGVEPDNGKISTKIPEGVRDYKPPPNINIESPPEGLNKAKENPQLLPQNVMPPKMSADPVMQKFGLVIDAAAKKHNVSPRLIQAIIETESGGLTDAVSDKGAKGLMQLTDSTATDMGVHDVFDPEQNISGGAKYIRKLLDKFNGDLRLALAAYNAGPATVAKYDGMPPFAETRKYVEKIIARLGGLGELK